MNQNGDGLRLESNPRLDWLGVVCLAVITIVVICCFVAGATTRIPWADELYLYFGVHHTSFGDLVASIKSARNVMPPLLTMFFYVVDLLTGGSLMAGRILSLIASVGAIFVIFRILRRYVDGVGAAAICLITVVLTPEFQFHLFEYRSYGLMLLATAIGCEWLLEHGDRDTVSRRALVVNAAIQLAVVQSGTANMLYSGMFLAVMLALDLLRLRFRPWVYLSFSIAWLTIPINIMIGRASKAGLGPQGFPYLGRPTLGALTDLFNPDLLLPPLVTASAILLLGLLILAHVAKSNPSESRQVSWLPPVSMVGLATGLLLIPVVIWGISLIESIWHPRYMFPTLIGWALVAGILYRSTVTPLLQHLAAAYKEGGGFMRMLPSALVALCLIMPFGVYGLVLAKRTTESNPRNNQIWAHTASANLQAKLEELHVSRDDYDLLATTDLNLYMLMLYYHPDTELTLSLDTPLVPIWQSFCPSGRYISNDEMTEHYNRIVLVNPTKDESWVKAAAPLRPRDLVINQHFTSTVLNASEVSSLGIALYERMDAEPASPGVTP